MNNFSKSAMIALLPVSSDWCKIELPHLTLVYAGEIDKLGRLEFNELGKAASMLALLGRPLALNVIGTEVFGDEDKVDVIRFRTSLELLAMRKIVEKWNASQYPFRPHSTIGPAGSAATVDIPRQIYFNKVYVGWGDESLTFSLTHS